MSSVTKKTPRTLGWFILAMINVAALGGIRSWPVSAEYGLSSVIYILLAAALFFIPSALVSSELATGWQKPGGVFAWVKEAFGHRTGFLAIWLQWIANVVWYPTMLSFIAATVSYLINPELAFNTFYMVTLILVIFWATTLINLLGMRISGLISTWGVVLGTFIPAALIIILGFLFLFSGKPLQISFSVKALLPNLGSIEQLVFFTGIILSFTGMEMSAVHTRDVKNPQTGYPRAIFLSVVLFLSITILGVLAIALVIPQGQISLVAGGLQAFSYFVTTYGLQWMTPLIVTLILIGALGTLSTWVVGPTKGLLAVAESGDLPPALRQVNAKGMPIALLIFQAIIVSLLSLIFLLMPTVNSGYWILSALVAELYLVMYILMFAAAIKLRYKRPHTARPFTIPGGKRGMWITAGAGIVSAVFVMFIGFFPPAQIAVGSRVAYVSFLVIGLVIFCLGPFFILALKKRSWEKSR